MAGQIVNQPQTDTPGTPVVVLNVNTTSKATTGTSEEVLATYTLPANTLSANGKAIRVTAWGESAANANAKVVRIRFGGIAAAWTASFSTTASGAAWSISSVIIRTGAATQVSIGSGSASPSGQTLVSAAPTATLSSAVDIVVTGLTATASGDVTFKGLIVEALN